MSNPQMPNDAPQGTPLGYAPPLSRQNRPGLVTAIGVISIVVASISGIFSLGSGFEGVAFYMMSRMSGIAGARAPAASTSANSSTYSSTSTGPTYSATAASPSTSMPSTAFTATEVAGIVQSAQQATGNRMTPVQLSTLSSTLSNPNQQLVTSTGAATAVTSAFVDAKGNANVVLSDGSVNIDAQGRSAIYIPSKANAAMQGFKVNPVACGLAAVDGLLSVGLAIYLLIAGILVLRRTAAGGRKMHLAYAVIKIPLAVGGSMAVAWMLTDFYSSLLATQPGGAAAAAGVLQGVAVVYAVGLALPALIYPIALLIVLNTRQLREYFNSVRT